LQNGDTFDELIDGTTNKAFTDTEQTKLSGIATGAEVNTINTALAGEPAGSDLVLNAVSLTQAEYDAGTPVATTFYIIT
jgi:copper chaperone CopZ